jgi:hypothetical protein
MPSKTWILIGIVAVLIVFVYIQDAKKINPETNILQTKLEDFHPELFSERSPLVIQDRIPSQDVHGHGVPSPASLLDTIFKYRFVQTSVDRVATDRLYINRATYVILYNASEQKQAMHIFHPKYIDMFGRDAVAENAPFVDMRLAPNQCIVLPSKWAWTTNVQGFTATYLYNVVHAIAGFAI